LLIPVQAIYEVLRDNKMKDFFKTGLLKDCHNLRQVAKILLLFYQNLF